MKHITVYRVRAGSFSRLYYTRHHAEQMERALRLHGMDPVIEEAQMPRDDLTRLTVKGAP